ncbi:MAG: EAL domain-containing protein, partial [Pseudomonadota bacterium]
PAPPPPRFRLEICDSLSEAIRALDDARALGSPCAVVFIDPRCMERGPHGEPIPAIRAADAHVNIVVTTVSGAIGPGAALCEAPPPDKLLYFPKPFQPHVLRRLASSLGAKWRAEEALRQANRLLEAQVAARTRELAELNQRLLWDIEQRRTVEAALQRSEERYALAARAANDALWDWDLATDRIFFSGRWFEMLGMEPVVTTTTPEIWFARVHPDERHPLRVTLREHIEGGATHFEVEHRLRCADGAYRWVLCRGLLCQREDGTPARLVGSMSDVTARKDAEARLVHDALHDTLTGLPNRTLFLERLQHAIQVARRNPNLRSALVFLDLDGFKLVNDSMGHLAGDELLRAVAARIERCLRSTDLLSRFGTEQALARFGGDEFTILLVGIHDNEDAVRAVRRILRELSRPFPFNGQQVYTSASAGIAFVDARSADPDSLLRNADIAMYRAKEAGRSTFAIFDTAMHAQAVERLELETALRQAMERGQLYLVYQPVIDLETGRIRGFEALLRWRHPQRGVIPPDDFVPLAEETGLINPIGAWVLREACKQAAAWHHAFPEQELTMAVNISSRQFSTEDLGVLVRTVLEDTGLPARCLKLEITESVLVENDVTFLDTFRQLEALGVALHMDDFGTGYSSLSYLHRFPFETIKIDRSFVAGMGEGPRREQLVGSIVGLAHALGMQTTAEGVETGEQLSWLRARHCQYAQGFLFSRPVEASMARLLIERAPRWLA